MQLSQTDSLGQSAPNASAAPPPAPSLPHRLLELADRHRRWLLGAIIALYLISFNGQWHIEPDSALYLSIARNLAEGRGYTYHGQPQNLAYPGWPFLVAATFRLFSSDNLWPAHILMLLFALAALGLTYRLLLLHAGRPVAVVVTCMLGVSETFHRYAFQLRNDMPFLVGVLAVLVGYEAILRLGSANSTSCPPPLRVRWFDWLLLIAGLALAMVMRPVMLVFVPLAIVFVCWAIYRSPLRWPRLLIIMLILAAAIWVFLQDPRRSNGRAGVYEEDVYGNITARAGQTLQEIRRDRLPQLIRELPAAAFGHELGPGLNVVATLALGIMGVALVRRRVLWGLWIAATPGILLLTVVGDRYFLPVLPLLIYAWWLWGGIHEPPAGPALGRLDAGSHAGFVDRRQWRQDRRRSAGSALHAIPQPLQRWTFPLAVGSGRPDPHAAGRCGHLGPPNAKAASSVTSVAAPSWRWANGMALRAGTCPCTWSGHRIRMTSASPRSWLTAA